MTIDETWLNGRMATVTALLADSPGVARMRGPSGLGDWVLRGPCRCRVTDDYLAAARAPARRGVQLPAGTRPGLRHR